MALDYKKIGEKIKELRKNKGLSQTELAENVGSNLYQKSISNAEKNIQQLTAEQYAALADFFGVTLDELLCREQPEKDSPKLTEKDICKMLLDIFNSCEFRFNEITLKDQHYSENPFPENDQFPFDIKEDEYIHKCISIYFPTLWNPISISEDLYAQTYGNNTGTIYINHFLSRLIDIINLAKKGNLSHDMFDRLCQSYLEDVPDTVAYIRPSREEIQEFFTL